jgi:hypothetical protein
MGFSCLNQIILQKISVLDCLVTIKLSLMCNIIKSIWYFELYPDELDSCITYNFLNQLTRWIMPIF